MKEKYSVLNFYRRRLLVSIEGFRIERLVQKAFERGIAIRSLRIVSETRAEGWIAGADLKELSQDWSVQQSKRSPFSMRFRRTSTMK